MFIEIKLTYFIVAIFCLEIVIYFWSAWTATQKDGNYFAIPRKLIFEKCARNSGRISAILNLIILFFIGYFGLKQIYSENEKGAMFFSLVTIFTINHLIHFFYITQNFKQKSKVIKLSDEKHGIFTFVCITLFPIFLWYFKNLNLVLYTYIILHLFNVSYAFIDVLYNKIRVNSKVTSHNRLGIFATISAWIFIVYRIFIEYYYYSIISRHQ
jgi:hypothetical protein